MRANISLSPTNIEKLRVWPPMSRLFDDDQSREWQSWLARQGFEALWLEVKRGLTLVSATLE